MSVGLCLSTGVVKGSIMTSLKELLLKFCTSPISHKHSYLVEFKSMTEPPSHALWILVLELNVSLPRPPFSVTPV